MILKGMTLPSKKRLRDENYSPYLQMINKPLQKAYKVNTIS
jgi:hypothetical protein